jgi:hypothetical protein
MLLEVYAQSIDGTGIYSVYLALLLSMSISAYLYLSDASLTDSCLLHIKFKPSASETAFKNKADLNLNMQLQNLKRIKIKIDPGEDTLHFPPFSLLKNTI